MGVQLSDRLNDTLELDGDGMYGVASDVLATIMTTVNVAAAIAALFRADAAEAFSWSANAATLDLSQAHNFAATNAMGGNCTLTLANGVDGCNGVIAVQQDATGGRTLAFVIAGRTVRKDLNVPDTNPFAVPSAITMYQYFFVTLVGVQSVVLNKVYLQ